MKMTIVKPDYPYARIEGEKRDQFIHHYSEEMTREEVLRLVANLAAKGENPEAIELHAFAEGFCRGFFGEPDQAGYRLADSKTGTPWDSQQFAGCNGGQSKHMQNGSANGWFTKRQMSGDYRPGLPASGEDA